MNQPLHATPITPLAEALIYAERCRSEGRVIEAEAVCRQILQAQGQVPDAEHLLGIISHQNGKLDQAIEHVQRAIRLAPRAALFHTNLGEMLRQAGRPRLAVAAARRAVEIEPSMGVAWSNLGVALFELKDYEEAATAQRKAITAEPDFPEGHCNLGNALHALKRHDEAIDCYRRAIALRPNYVDAWANLGTTLHHNGSFDEAIATLRRAIALGPHHANAHCGLGILLLMRGDYGEGWEEYEWRLHSAAERTAPKFPENPWQGESLAGKHIYVQAEQGFGDTIQFARYIPLLAARAGKVTLRVPQQLLSLLRESFPGVEILGERGDVAPYQYDTTLLSLPRLFRTRLETIPAETPYLQTPLAAVQRWTKQLGALTGLKVGIVWAGNFEHVNDHSRSLDLKILAPVFDVTNATFVSLQHGSRAADLKKLKHKTSIEDIHAQLQDFTDTAAAIAALDLIITVDTSVAHLAGALGKPVWVILPWVTDWRWLLERDDNHWYPTMRLFRQKRSGNAAAEEMTDVIARVAAELLAVADGDHGRLMPFKAEAERRAELAAGTISTVAAFPPEPLPSAYGQLNPAINAGMATEPKRSHDFLADAETLVRHSAASEPDDAEAAHTLGIVAHQSGKTAEAIEHIKRAIALRSDVSLYHANLGEMCRLAGRIAEAIAAGERAIALDPNNASAYSNLGIALFEQERFEEALSHYDAAISIEPDFAQAHSNRGNALQRLKRFAEAELSYRRAVGLLPGFSDAWNNLGTCLRELKRPEEAETVYRKALELNPNNPDTFDNLALAIKDLDRFDEAADLMRRALALDARSDKFLVHYATILLDQKKTIEAAAMAERALTLNVGNHDAVNVMGRVAFDRGDLNASLGYYRRAIALKPDLADAYNNMGNVLKELGHLKEAEEAFVEALRLDPDIPGVYVNLADSRKFASGDAYLTAMERLAAKTEGLSNSDRMQLDFALGKAYADLKDYDRSFRHLQAGNAAKRASVTYDESGTFALFERVEATFTRQMIEQAARGGDPSTAPIFVIGMPRSGTTLVEQILASHPAVHGAGELLTLNEVLLTVRRPDRSPFPYPEFMPALNAGSLRQIGAQYVQEVRKLAPDGERVTDKMPSNYYFAGLIHLALPNAKIIHMIRDPVDTCISCFSKLFADEQSHTYDLAELGRYYMRYHRLMAHWRAVLPPGRILDVRYEEVVANLEAEARRIIEYCDLPWDERCLSFHKTERPVRTASAIQVRQPIYNRAIGRWRVYERHLDPLLSALGGDLVS